MLCALEAQFACMFRVLRVGAGCCGMLPCRKLRTAAHTRFEVDSNLAKNKECIDFALLASDGVA